MPSINQQKLNILCLIENEHTDLTVKEPTLIEGEDWGGVWKKEPEVGGTDEWNDILNGSNTKTFLTQSYSNFISRGKAGGKILY